MSDCPFCDAGIPKTRKAFLEVIDPKTGIPTGEHLVLTEQAYNQLKQAVGRGLRVAANAPGDQHG